MVLSRGLTAIVPEAKDNKKRVLSNDATFFTENG